MANRMIEGWDFLDTANLNKRFHGVVGTGATVQSGGRITGNYFRIVGSTDCYLRMVFDNQATWIVGFAFRFQSGDVPYLFSLQDSAVVHVQARINSASQKIEVLRSTTLLATGTTVFVPNTWYYLEFKITISDTVGVVDAQVNGIAETFTFVTGTGSTQDTRNGGNATANIVNIGVPGGSQNGIAPGLNWDDLYINDGSGGVDDTYWGDIRVIEKTVDGAGNSAQFTPSTGSNWQNVDDATPDGDSTYNESGTVNHIDSMTTAALGVTGTVKGVELSVEARKTDGGAGSLAPLWRISGTDYPGTGQALATDYVYISQRYRVSPATSSAWTVTEIDGAEIGYKRTA